MSGEQLKRAAIALGVLVFLWGAIAVFRPDTGEALEALDIPSLVAAEVDSISIVSGGDTIVLEQADATRWTVNGYLASASAVRDLFDAFSGSTRSELIARDTSSHERMGVDDASAKRMRFLKGPDALLDLYVGKRGGDFRSTYVRRPGDGEVYALYGSLPSYAGRALDDWREKRIAAVVTENATEVTVQRGDDAYTLSRPDGPWVISAGGLADTAEVRRLLGELRNIMATAFATDAQLDSADFERPDRRLTVTGQGGQAMLDLRFDSIPSGFLVASISELNFVKSASTTITTTCSRICHSISKPAP